MEARLLLAAPLLYAFGDGLWTHLRQPDRFRRVLTGVGASHAVWLVTSVEGLVLGFLVFSPRWGAVGALIFLAASTSIVWTASRTKTD